MGMAAEASPEITRLVIGVNRRVAPAHGERLAAMARDRGLDSLDLLPPFADFLLDGLLTPQIAQLRMRYAPAARINARLTELEEKGLIELDRGAYRATERLSPLLKDMRSAVADVAAKLWEHNEVEISVLTEAARQIREQVTPEQVVAAAHKKVREPLDRYSLLEHRLVTLRYMRQHDHAMAWIDRNLTAGEAGAMTALWRGEEAEIDEGVAESLREKGFLKKSEPYELTSKGTKTREAIEDETNQRSDAGFAALDEDEAQRFLTALKAMPS